MYLAGGHKGLIVYVAPDRAPGRARGAPGYNGATALLTRSADEAFSSTDPN